MASPSAYEELGRIFASVDIRSVLPAIHVPTLVLARTDDKITDAPQARYIAEQIDGALYVEMAGADHIPFVGDADGLLDQIEEFVTGRPPTAAFDTILSTVLFTDIVDSTAKQAAMGDRAWKELVLAHHAVVRGSLERWRGVENDTAGDGFYATFDGAARAIHAAQEVTEHVRDLGIEVRAGVHTGECEVIEGKCGGLTVSIGARVAANAGPSEVLVSQTVKDLVAGTGLTFDDAGEHELKGVPDRWRLYRVSSS